MSIRLVVCVSDLHCGSTVGLLPSDFKRREGQSVGQNAVQEWLWACWRDAWDVWVPSVVGSDPWALVVNGDIIDGNHHGTKQIISPDPADHVKAAVECLRPIAAKASATFLVEGTESHVGDTEHDVATMLGGVPDPDTGRPAWQRLSLTVAGTRVVFQHHIATSARMYLRASALSIFLANEQLEAAGNGEVIPKVLGCAHRHTSDYYERPEGVAFVTGAWQVLTRFGMKVVPSARCKPSVAVLDWRDRADGDIPRVHIRSYKAPHAKGASI